jgi:predicted O-methyltransferase YrrM
MIRYFSLFEYWFKAKKRHNIHSPFVYEFSDRCLAISFKAAEKEQIKRFKSALLSSEEKIEITDFGAGSKRLSNHRSIRQIFQVSRSKNQYAKLLFQLSSYYKPTRILEFGTSLAWGTFHLHLGHPDARIDTVEGCPATHAAAIKYFPRHQEHINFHQMTFESYIAKLKDDVFDLIFIDGNHRGDALQQYLDALIKHSHNQTIWVLDDIRWTDDMWQAWNRVVQDKRFHVTLDLQRVGIAVQRKTQEKEHFFLKL